MSGKCGKALFAFTAQAPNQISLEKGEVIKLISVGGKGGWSKGTNTAGATGFFPTDYVQQQVETPVAKPVATSSGGFLPPPSASPASTATAGPRIKAKAMYAFAGTGPNEMALSVGQIVDIVRRGPAGGWCKGPSGAFPTDYVKFLDDNDASSNTAAVDDVSSSTTSASDNDD